MAIGCTVPTIPGTGIVNPHKLLIDPYATVIDGPILLTDAHFGYRRDNPRGDVMPDKRDSARSFRNAALSNRALAGARNACRTFPGRRRSSTSCTSKATRSCTRMYPNRSAARSRGWVHLRYSSIWSSLGVTAIELLPIHAIVDEQHLVSRGLRNYWGYSSINFFAADDRFIAGDRVREFRTMVANLHAAGIEVLLDVVYNHTGEGNEFGPTLSFRGIDNASYYLLEPDKRKYADVTGCGNSLNLRHPRVLQMVMDSLRFWVQEMHVDGFRFDLATTLAREAHGYDLRRRLSGLYSTGSGSIASEDDCRALGYRPRRLPGWQFPPGWAEWNDRFRDTARRFWRGDAHVIGELAAG